MANCGQLHCVGGLFVAGGCASKPLLVDGYSSLSLLAEVSLCVLGMVVSVFYPSLDMAQCEGAKELDERQFLGHGGGIREHKAVHFGYLVPEDLVEYGALVDERALLQG